VGRWGPQPQFTNVYVLDIQGCKKIHRLERKPNINKQDGKAYSIIEVCYHAIRICINKAR
jgi:hypothetical protein